MLPVVMLRELLDLHTLILYRNTKHPKETRSEYLNKLSTMEVAEVSLSMVEPGLTGVEVSTSLS